MTITTHLKNKRTSLSYDREVLLSYYFFTTKWP